MDKGFFNYFYNLQSLNSAVPGVAVFFASYLPYLLAAGLLVYLAAYRNRAHSLSRRLFIIASTLLSSILAYVGVLLFRSVSFIADRPFVSLPDIKPLVDTGQAFQSFPSLHSAIFFAAGMFLYFYHTKLGILYLGSAVLISVARVVAGVHWPIDILVGAGVGVLAAFVVRWFTRGIKRNL